MSICAHGTPGWRSDCCKAQWLVKQAGESLIRRLLCEPGLRGRDAGGRGAKGAAELLERPLQASLHREQRIKPCRRSRELVHGPAHSACPPVVLSQLLLALAAPPKCRGGRRCSTTRRTARRSWGEVSAAAASERQGRQRLIGQSSCGFQGPALLQPWVPVADPMHLMIPCIVLVLAEGPGGRRMKHPSHNRRRLVRRSGERRPTCSRLSAAGHCSTGMASRGPFFYSMFRVNNESMLLAPPSPLLPAGIVRRGAHARQRHWNGAVLLLRLPVLHRQPL